MGNKYCILPMLPCLEYYSKEIHSYVQILNVS